MAQKKPAAPPPIMAVRTPSGPPLTPPLGGGYLPFTIYYVVALFTIYYPPPKVLPLEGELEGVCHLLFGCKITKKR
jgi:hypothetical protein